MITYTVIFADDHSILRSVSETQLAELQQGDRPFVANENRTTYGWKNGEYHCRCGTIFGKNLKNESPFALVAQHLQTCEEYNG